MFVPVLMPNFFAWALAAMAQVASVITGTTATGLPRSAGFSCCSTLAKKLFKSRNSQSTSGLAGSSMVGGSDGMEPTMP